MKKIVLATLIACAPMAAMAVDSYVGVNLGSSAVKLELDSIGSGTAHKAAAKIYGGFQINDNVGFELGYADLGKNNIKIGAAQAHVAPKPVYLAVTGTWPLNDKFALFGKAGAARNRTDSFDTGAPNERYSTTSNIWGIGASYAINRQLSAVAEFESFGNLAKAEDLDGSARASMLSLGLRFNF